MKLTIVGVGALGSHVALFARNLAAERVVFRFVDYDRVEMKNLQSQFYPHMTVGKNKAIALRDTFRLLGYMMAHNEAIPFEVREDNVMNVLAGSDLVVDCVDNAPTRRLVQSWAGYYQIPCLHGGLAADGMFGRIQWDNQFSIDEAAEGAATCEGGEHLPFIVRVASYMSTAIQTFVKEGKKIGFSLLPNGQVVRV